MEPLEGQTNTDIVEELPVTPPKQKGRWLSWVLPGLIAVLLMTAFAMLYLAAVPPRKSLPAPTAEDLEQQKYDTEQRQREDQKAAQLRNEPFLVRKGDDSQRELNSLLKDLITEKDSSADLPTPLPDQQAKAEEEAIAGVLRESNPVPANSAPPQSPPQARPQGHRGAVAQTSPATSPSEKDTGPMFVYSRTFGGAKYVDLPPKQSGW